jgi:predicted Zn finger-like uncharacterized protein
MITVQCPNCQTRYSLDEKQFGNQTSLQLRCKKCQTTFPSQVREEVRPMETRHGLIQHDQFKKRLQTVATSSPLEATSVKGGNRPWLDRGSIFSLIVIDGPMKGTVFPLVKPSVLLGRREADIVLDDSDVSRKHCSLEVHGTSAMLSDLGSTNGTFVDDQKIETHQLEHMSEFRIGSTTMIFSVREKE